MTTETFQAIVTELQRRDVPATFEYPGYIQIEFTDSLKMQFGDANETFGGELYENGAVIEPYESIMPRDTTDAQAVTDFIVCLYSAALEVQSDPKPDAFLDYLKANTGVEYEIVCGEIVRKESKIK